MSDEKIPTPNPIPTPKPIELPQFNTAEDIINLADRYYPDGAVGLSWDPKNHKASENIVWDGLARFIAVELAETFAECETATPAGQLENAAEYIAQGAKELQEVASQIMAYMMDYLTAQFLVFALDLMAKSGDPLNIQLLNGWGFLIPKSLRDYRETVHSRLCQLLPGWEKRPPKTEEVKKVLETLAKSLTIGPHGSGT